MNAGHMKQTDKVDNIKSNYREDYFKVKVY